MSIQKGNEFFNQGLFEKAAEEYRKVPQSSPLYAQAQFNLSLLEKQYSIPAHIDTTAFIESDTQDPSLTEYPLISVIMPVFNVASYLPASIESVLKQSYGNFELIIINDASTDNSLDVIKKYQQTDGRIKLINLDFNTLGGAGIPSNIGLENATGQYVAFLDSDDMMAEGALEQMLSTAQKHQTDVVIADFKTFTNGYQQTQVAYDKDRWNALPLDQVFSAQQYPEVFRLSPVPWRKLYKTTYLKQYHIQFPEGDWFYEDNPLHWFVLTTAKRIVLLDYVVAHHRMDRDGQTMGADSFKLAAQFCHLNTIKYWLEQQSQVPDVYWQELIDFCYRASWIVDKQTDRQLKVIVQKRYAQTVLSVIKQSGLPQSLVESLRPNLLDRCQQYTQNYSDKELAIVIPVYNCVDLIGQLLEQVSQINLKTEVFIIDDGSTDGSYQYCQQFAQKYPNIILIQQPNKGAGVARNAIIPLVTAQYTYFVDADDLIIPQHIEAAYRQAIEHQQDLVFGRYKIQFYENNTERGMWKADETYWIQMLAQRSNQRELRQAACQLTNYPWNRLIKTSLLHDENIFFGKTVVHNDVPFHWHTLVAAHNIGVYDQVFCIHRKFEQREQITNITDKRRLQVLEAYRYTHHLLKAYACYAEVFPLWQKFIRDLLSWARDRVPEKDLSFYKKQHKQIVEALKQELETKAYEQQHVGFKNNLFKTIIGSRTTLIDNIPLVSIIIPIYNVEKYLRSCLDSAINQTLQKIEIICVDDCSTDSSASILREYEQKDPRIKAIYQKSNQGTSQARKDAVLTSVGRYIMFMDGDDFLELNAAEIAYNSIEEKQVDILHFGTNIINVANIPKERIALNEKLVSPYIESSGLKGDMLRYCFEDKKFYFQLWNKIYRGDICRQAFRDILDGYYPKANDLYAFFVIAYNAKSYFGIANKLYNYNFGIGITGGNFLTLEAFRNLLKAKDVQRSLVNIISRKGKNDYDAITQNVYNGFLHECVTKWRDLLPIEHKQYGLELLMEKFEDAIPKFAELFWYDPTIIGNALIGNKAIQHRKRESKKLTIAFYYRSIAGGGAQRVTAMLSNLLASETEYKIVLITDNKKQEEEFELSSIVKREYISSSSESIAKNYMKRFWDWQRILSENSIDIVVSGMWLDPCTFWDMLSIKSYPSKPAFIVHSHSFCMVPFLLQGVSFKRLLSTYKNCDAVVTLSEADKEYVEAFNQNVTFIENPIAFDIPALEKDYFSEKVNARNTIMWCGRIYPEKNPLDVIEMMKYVINKIPDAKLLIVGDGEKSLLNEMKQRIQKYQLNKNIEFIGFTLNTMELYSQTTVFVHTAKYEGWGNVYVEAMSWGIPVVTYDMPWNSLFQNNSSITTVKQGRYDLLADEVIKLLQNDTLTRQRGIQCREYMEKLNKIDRISKWKQLFKRLGVYTNLSEHKRITHTLFEYASMYHIEAMDNILKNNKQDNITKLNTLRIDVKNFNHTNPKNDVKIEILDTDAHITESTPEWFARNNNGIGHVLSCIGGYAKFLVTTLNEGELNISIKATKIHIAHMVIPLYMICDQLIINDETIISEPTIVSHDNSYICKYKAESSGEFIVHVKWRYCDIDINKHSKKSIQ